MKYDYDLCVIGGGSAGLTVASGAAQLGLKVLLVEREQALGGDCLHYGCVPSKTLLASAKAWSLMGRARDMGLPEVDRRELDFAKVSERIASVIAAIQKHDSVERFRGLGVEVVFGAARFLDEHKLAIEPIGSIEFIGSVKTGGGPRTVSAARIVLATGSSASVPPLPGLDQTPHWTNRDLFSLTELPESLAILGGGAIACEMAQAFARFGVRVTIIQRSGRILSKEDPDLAGVVADSLEADGVELRTGSDLVRVGPSGKGVEVVVKRGGLEESVCAERLLVALGRMANVDGLDLGAAGVRFSNRGVEVDRRLRTSQKHIFACGDVTGKHQFTHAAGYEGGVVVANAAFRLPRKADYTWMPHCTYTEPELASVGLTERAARDKGLEYRVWTEPFVDNDRARAEGHTQGRVKVLLDKRSRPLGVHIAGPGAGDLLSPWLVALGGKVSLATMASVVQPYPTLAEINKRLAGQVLSEKIFSDRVRKILHFFFRYQGRACG